MPRAPSPASAPALARPAKCGHSEGSGPGTTYEPRSHGAARLVSRLFQSPDRPDLRKSETSRAARSEEHTSELQSHLNLVCRLLLEKKKSTHVTVTLWAGC